MRGLWLVTSAWPWSLLGQEREVPASSVPYPRPAILGPVAPSAPPDSSTLGSGLQGDAPRARCIPSFQNVGS